MRRQKKKLNILTPRMTANERWQKHFEKLIKWAKSKGYMVKCETDADDRIEFETKTIYIDSRNWAERRYYTLLHECGHLLIDKRSDSFTKYLPCPLYVYSNDRRTTKTDGYKVSLIAEEIDAWRRGLRLASRLKLPVDRKKFDEEMARSVMSYIEVAAEENILKGVYNDCYCS